jgi:hypothetical protein
LAGASTPSPSNNDILELFPGVYPGGITMNGGTVYMNPGVYILGGDFKSTGGTLCVFGAPVCDVIASGTGTGGAWDYLSTQTSNSNKNVIPYYLSSSATWSTADCGSAVFTPTTDPSYVDARTWFYYCSPWGFWDPNTSRENVTCTVSGCSGSTGHPTVLDTGAPVFVNEDGSASSTKMNGVTIYMRSGNVKITGNAGQAHATTV